MSLPLSLLPTLWQNRNKIAVGLMILALVVAGFTLRSMSRSLADTRAKLEATEAQYSYYKDQAEMTVKALADLQQKDAANRAAAKQREREIRNVPKDQDGAVAPVLRDSLNRLRGASGS